VEHWQDRIFHYVKNLLARSSFFSFELLLPPPPKVMGGYVFAGVGMYVDIYVCEQLPGANSSPIVTKLGQSYPWPQGTRYWKVKGQGRWGRCALYWALLVDFATMQSDRRVTATDFISYTCSRMACNCNFPSEPMLWSWLPPCFLHLHLFCNNNNWHRYITERMLFLTPNQ